MSVSFSTLTGIPLEHIPSRLAVPFDDPRAYRGVPGAADLTDINTGHMIERVNEVFGPKGVGWNLLFQKDDLQVFGDPLSAKRITVRLAFAVFQYTLVDGEGGRVTCEIPTSGINTNDFVYAEEGARTSALGAALKGIGFQLPVYKGLLDHHNAGRLLGAGAPAAEPAAPAGNGHLPAPAAPRPNGSGAAPKPAQAEPGVDVLDEPADALPGDFIVPLGKNTGRKLSEVSAAWVQWAANDMQPASEAAQALQAAARAFLAQKAPSV